MIYFENASRGVEGLNTHVMAYTLAISLANFLERDLYFDHEIPSSTPPAYLQIDELRRKFEILVSGERSLVSDLLDLPARRTRERGPAPERKLELQLVPSHFVTTDAVKKALGGTIIWDSFAVGRYDLTREYLNSFELIEWTHTKLCHLNYFYFLPRSEKDRLLESVQLRYMDPIEKLAERIIHESPKFNSAHLRFGDFEKMYRGAGYTIDPESFNRFLRVNLPDQDVPLLAATDGLEHKELFRRIFKGFDLRFIDEVVFDDYGHEFALLPFTDFNVLTILNQLICAAGDRFVGTYRSTFTGIIHRLRQERYGKRDFDFFPDEKVSQLLTPEGLIAPDRPGFFDWNRYSAFAEDHMAMAWKREWDRELSSIGD